MNLYNATGGQWEWLTIPCYFAVALAYQSAYPPVIQRASGQFHTIPKNMIVPLKPWVSSGIPPKKKRNLLCCFKSERIVGGLLGQPAG